MLMLANRIPSECQADFSSHRRFHDLLLGLIGVRCCCNLHVKRNGRNNDFNLHAGCSSIEHQSNQEASRETGGAN
jgi:hypothetical protein